MADSFGMRAKEDRSFCYGDSDEFLSELSEIFSFSEQEELLDCCACFKSWWIRYLNLRKLGVEKTWHDANKDETLQKNAILSLLEETELLDVQRREDAVKSIVYLVMGCFGEVIAVAKAAQRNPREIIAGQMIRNIYLLYEAGVYALFCNLLAVELDWHDPPRNDSDVDISSGVDVRRRSDAGEKRKPATCIQDNVVLRRHLSVLCIFVETMRREFPVGFPEMPGIEQLVALPAERMTRLQTEFLAELGSPVIGDQTLTVVMLNMVMKYCSLTSSHYPVRKVVILLWKSVLAWLGGWKALRERKAKLREEAGLPPFSEDTAELAQTMDYVTFPSFGSIADDKNNVFLSDGESKEDGSEEEGTPSRALLRSRQKLLELRKSAPIHNSEDDPDPQPDALDSDVPMESDDDETASTVSESESTASEFGLNRAVRKTVTRQGLLWTPKIREHELCHYLQRARNKFFGYVLPDDPDTTAGFPPALERSVDTLRKYRYTPLSEVQVKNEERYSKYIFSQTEGVIPETPPELLYTQLLHQMPQYMIALLKILLAGAPTARTKNDSINILVDLLPNPRGDDQTSTDGKNPPDEHAVIQAVDIQRHKEVIVKAVSSTLLLFLKHFKTNHVYQFECVCQHLVFANCIPLILKFFDQNVLEHVQSMQEISEMTFPENVLAWAENGRWYSYDDEDLGAIVQRRIECGPQSNLVFRWRNLFTAINLLRILNKFTKWKTSRTMMLVVFKSASILRRALNVPNILLQLYALKLLKMQARYLGRQWRKTNMDLMSAIYSKVRHRLNDDWAYGNETNAKPWDFNIEECNLRTRVEKFNMRRYGTNWSNFTTGMSGDYTQHVVAALANPFSDPEFRPYETNFLSVLNSEEVLLSERFKEGYESWLQREVFAANINWDLLM